MYKVYFKQAVQMLKQNLFISIISILGTALAIMMIMTIIVTEEVKTISIAPEINRDRTLYVSRQFQMDTIAKSARGTSIDYNMVKEYLSDLKTPKLISLVNYYVEDHFSLIGRNAFPELIDAIVRTTNDSYWKIMSFSFIAGKPFGHEEFQSGVQVAVLSQTIAKKLFPDEEAVGKTIDIDFVPFRVTGVVKDVSPVFKEASGDIWVPITSKKNYRGRGLIIMLLAEKTSDFPAIAEEVRSAEKKYDAVNKPWTLYLNGPQDRKTYAMNLESHSIKEEQTMLKTEYRKTIFIFLILLLIPAVNLSGFSLSRIKKRTEEIGVRKAFGAKKYIIMIQVLYENMITSLTGGIIGLILSYIAVHYLRHWLLNIPTDSTIPVSTLVSLPVFFAVFILCILINLFSAAVPAYKASRIVIADSLHKNDKQL